MPLLQVAEDEDYTEFFTTDINNISVCYLSLRHPFVSVPQAVYKWQMSLTQLLYHNSATCLNLTASHHLATYKIIKGVTSKMYCHLDDLALEGDEYSAPRCSRFTPWKHPVHTAQEAGRQWGQYAWHEKSHPYWDLIPRQSSPNEVAILITLSQ